MDFEREYRKNMTRLGVFRASEEFEIQKTVATVDALLKRADALHRGCRPAECYGIDVDNLLTRAEGYLSALERGERPLKGKFTEPGIAFVDHCFIERDGVMHVFYNRGYIGYDWPEQHHDTIGHATSTDLVNWTIHTPVLSVSPDDFGTFQVWSPAVIEKDGRFYMLYTGVNENIAQASCLAVSEDLFHFRKYEKNPVYIPGPWSRWDADSWSDCRDSFVLRDGDTFYQYVCVSTFTESGERVPETGITSSSDLISWKEEGTFRMPSCGHAAESPFVLKRGERWYFFYTNCGKGTSYAVGSSPTGPWEEQGLLFGARIASTDSAHVPSCAEVFCFKGKWYISVCERLPGWEQYLEIYELFWEEDGSVRVGELVK